MAHCRQAVILLLALVMLISFPADGPGREQSLAGPSGQGRILVLNSYHTGLPVPDGIDAGIVGALRQANVSMADLYLEKLDLSRIPGDAHRAGLARMLANKLAGKQIDAVIIEGYPAVEFAAEHGHGLIPDKALLVTVASPDLSPLEKRPNKIVNIPWRIDPAGTLKVALSVFPETRQVIVVTAARDFVMPFLKTTREALLPWKERLDIRFTNAMTYEEMIAQVSATSPDTIILYAPYFNDTTGRSFVPAEVARTLAEVANAPVFTVLDIYMGNGFVGGSLITTEQIGGQAAKAAADYLAGRLQPGLRVTELETPSTAMFDWSAIQRWKGNTGNLPEDSIIINRPPSLWRQHKANVLAALAVILLLMIMVLVSFRQNRRRASAEASARMGEARLRVLIDQAPDAIVVYDADRDRFVDANPKAESLFGCSREELFGSELLRFFPADRPAVFQRIQAYFEEAQAGKFLELELKVLGSSGAETPCEVRLVRLPSEEGRLFRFSFVDITLRNQTDTALRESEQRFRQLFEGAAVPQCFVGKDGRLLDSNASFDRAFGYTREDVPTLKEWWPLAYPDPVYRRWVIDTWEAAVRRAVAQKTEIDPMEYEVTCKNGEVRVMVISGTVLGDDFLATFFDVTERKRAEAERERLMAAIEQTSDIVFITDPESRIQFVNRAFESVTGYSREEAVGNTPRILKSGVQEKGFYKELWTTLSQGETWRGRIINRRKDGTLFTEEATISPVRDASGRIVNYVASKRDITEHLRLENRFQQAQKMESIGRLAGGVAHDFNNMLAVILGYAEIALKETDPEGPLHADLREIHDTALRSADLTRQLLAFARKQTILPKILDLNETVDGMLKMIQRVIGEDIDLAWVPGADLWAVKMDPTQIDQILMNLCVNARDAISGVGRLTIETENIRLDEAYCATQTDAVPGEYVMMAVSDSGIGMDAATQRLIFEPFFTTKEAGKGTGLGLSTVYGIVRQNNGFLNVYSEPGQGTTFKIYLPRHHEGVTEVPESEFEDLPLGSGKTVLLVEDEPAMLKMGTRMLERLGYHVIARGTPSEAIREAETHKGKISLLMTDVVMPEMNGQDLTERILFRRPDMKVLFMSGYTADVIAHHGVLKDGIHFIPKPFSLWKLAVKVREALSG